jgi:hypothetical protein
VIPGSRAFVGAVVIAASAFAAAGLLARAWVLAPLPLALAAGWLFCLRLPWRRLSGACFSVLLCGAAAGLLAGLPAPLLLAATLAGVAAWDLEALVRASRGAAAPAAARHAVLAHAARLIVILVVGALLGAAALFLRVRLGFGAILGIAALLAVSLTILLRSLARR